MELQLIDEAKPDETETAWVLARATAAGAGTATVASAIRFFLYGRTTAPVVLHGPNLKASHPHRCTLASLLPVPCLCSLRPASIDALLVRMHILLLPAGSHAANSEPTAISATHAFTSAAQDGSPLCVVDVDSAV